ncbi:MAG: hypothetical protein EOO06_16275 [Chitinophagaceae bacterium]|nr:MAG: hypothetical protein EOO06_16275 [Chitinophagaceae bacterium]
MKTIISILLVCFSGKGFSQNIDIKRKWIDENLSAISIDSQTVYLDIFGRYPTQNNYYLLKDTLRLYKKYTTSTDNFATQRVRTYDFILTNLTERTLTLIAIDSNSLLLTGGVKTIHFRDRSTLEPSDIQFDKIIFKATSCFGECPVMTLQIDRQKKLKFIGGRYSVKEGFYTAALPDSLFQLLIGILAISDVDKLKSPGLKIFDAPEYTLEIHYNGKVKYLNTVLLPAISHELLAYLLDISKKVTLKPSKPFNIKFSKAAESN